MYTDATIINGLKSGDEKAYKHLYDCHYSVLCGMASHYIKDPDAAEMIVSDIIYSIWKNRDHLEIKQSLRNYLLQAIKNGCINYINRQSKHIYIDATTQQLIEAIQEETHPLAKLIEQELDLKIKECIDSLPPLTREIFLMSRSESLKYDEIALRLNISIDVVKYHMKSALSHLRKDLKDYLIMLLIFLFPH